MLIASICKWLRRPRKPHATARLIQTDFNELGYYVHDDFGRMPPCAQGLRSARQPHDSSEEDLPAVRLRKCAILLHFYEQDLDDVRSH